MNFEEAFNLSKEEILSTLLPLLNKEDMHTCLTQVQMGSSYLLEKVHLDVNNEALKKTEGLLKEQGKLSNELSQGARLQDLLGITNEQMEALYQEAIKLFQTKEQLLTKGVFLFLCVLNPTMYPFWLGLAAAEWHLGDLPQAEKLYERAIDLGNASPEPYYYAAQFYEQTKKSQEALDLYKQSIDKAHNIPEFSTIEELSKGALHRILTT